MRQQVTRLRVGVNLLVSIAPTSWVSEPNASRRRRPGRFWTARGVVVWIRPGWVHRWDDIVDVDGTLVLFRPEMASQVPFATSGLDPTSVDKSFAVSREVSWYANQLGHSARTLSRATLRAVGRTAKQFVDDRVVLEAKRLLAHGKVSVSECARLVGFDDPSNFTKYFRIRAGLPPGEFAATMSTVHSHG